MPKKVDEVFYLGLVDEKALEKKGGGVMDDNCFKR